MSNGRIHITLSPDFVRVTLEMLDALERQLSFLQTLQPSEKKRLVKPRPGTQEVLEGIAELQREAGIPPGEDEVGVFTERSRRLHPGVRRSNRTRGRAHSGLS